MDVILSIETSTSVCSAALHEKGNLIAVKEVLTPQSAAAQLAIQVEELFTETNKLFTVYSIRVCNERKIKLYA